MTSTRIRLTALLGIVAVLLLVANNRRRAGLAPRPPELTADLFPAEARPSTLSIPFALPLDVLVDLLEDAVPRTHGTTDSLLSLPDQGRTSVAIALERGPFRASVVDDVARLATTLRYSLRVSYDLPALPDPGGSCGFEERRPGLAVTLRSPISLGADWALRTHAEVAEVSPVSDDEAERCEVTVLGLDVTDRVVDGARTFLVDHLDEIDRRARQVDTRSRFEAWWRVLQEPIRLGDSLWLAIDPQSIMRGPVSGTGDSVRVDLALQARPRVLLGRRPELPRYELPRLDSGAVEPRLDLLVDGRADYAAGSRFLDDRLAGTQLELRGTSLGLESIRVYGIGGGRLALEVRVSGGIRGTLYFTGRPSVDAEAARVSVPDLDFDVATEEAVFGVVPTLVALSLRDFLREQAAWPLDPAVQWLADWLRSGLNRNLSNELVVTGAVDGVRIEGVYPLREVLLVRMSASGSASLTLTR